MSRFWFRRTYGIVSGVFLSVLAVEILIAQQPPQRFGGAYSDLDERRQQLVGDWVARFTKVTGQRLDARSFYDDILSLSTKTTFDAVTTPPAVRMSTVRRRGRIRTTGDCSKIFAPRATAERAKPIDAL